MIKQFLARSANNRPQVGIEIQRQGLAVVVCSAFTQAESGESTSFVPQVSQSSLLLNASSEGDLLSMLRDFVEHGDLQNAACNVILTHADYQLLMVEAPDVPEGELRDAIRWRVKDLISVPVENAAIDVFMLPADGSRGGKKMAYVVAAEAERVKSLIELVKDSGLKLESIDIGEMALRNLAFVKEQGHEEGHGVAIVRLVEGGGSVSLFRKGNMYLSRQFHINYSGGLLDDIPFDSFILEVQRSLDYYERQMGQAPPSVLYICGENISEDKITLDIKRGLNVPVQYLDLEKTVAVLDGIDEAVLHSCVAALGGAMRSSVMKYADGV
ncbi:MSHA biogenesis protein MshI [Alteromonadaceae bacterium Bs31]|nr:MSHA biogenesis protein MshI [Alteromonadaceae bacterium Bs31]